MHDFVRALACRRVWLHAAVITLAACGGQDSSSGAGARGSSSGSGGATTSTGGGHGTTATSGGGGGSTHSPNCGNGHLDPGEACDGDDLNGLSCRTIAGFKSGTLGCNSDCTGYVTTGCVAGATHKVGATFSEVSAAVANAAPGDTIAIRADSATWSSTLTVERGVAIVGAGVGSTIISGAVVPLIRYAPSASSFAKNYGFRVSGIEFDLLGSGQAIELSCACHLPAQTGIRIDHDKFSNSTAKAAGVEHTSCFGVVDHNTFEQMESPIRAWGDSCGGYSPSTFGRWSWESFGQYAYGTQDVLYFEDNTITLTPSHYMVSDGDQGCSYVFRYNTIDTGGDIYAAFDFHGGGQRGNLWSCRGGEIYGNEITGSGFLVSQRGGRVSTHHNTFSGGGTVNLYDNDGSPLQGVAPYVVEQRINDSYHFLDLISATGQRLGFSSSGGDDNGMVVQDSTYWLDAPTCEAPNVCASLTSGIGCGTLAHRPTSCAPGAGYWATNQSCGNLAGLIGASPASPLEGALYRCGADNGWAVESTPFAYPHPLEQ